MLIQDIRYAIRSLVKNRGVTSVAVLCLALGIGVNATIFSVIDGVMIKPYPFPDADQIAVPTATNQRLGVGRSGFSYPDFKDLRDQNTSFASVAAFTGRSLTISDGTGEPERFSGLAASWNLFDLLGIPPALGRTFNRDDDRPGAEPVVMLSDDVWRRRYNGDREIVGRSININGKPHTVIGVMPPGFRFPENQRVWVTVAPYSEPLARDWRSHQVFGRMRPGVTIDQARTEVKAIASRLEAAYPTTNRDWSAFIRPLQQWMLPEQVKLMLTTMMSAVTLVLLVACANVANLLLARATTRHREIALRAALGAGRWRIIRQLLTESVAIGLLSAPLGFLIAWIGIRLLDSAMPVDGVPWFIKWALDGRSLAYTIAVSMLTGIVFGLVPALQATGSSLQESLKEGGRGTAGGRRAWLRNTLVVAEIALSLVLLIGAALFVRSFLNQQNYNNGFDTAPLMTMRFYLPGEAYEPNDAKARRVDDIVRRVESVPGVQKAFASNFIPFSGGGGGGNVIVDGKPVEKGKEPSITFVTTSPHLRQTLDVKLVRGRDFTDTEGSTKSAVALVNETMAKQIWGDDDPIGRRFRMTGEARPDWFTVIGVIADFQHFQGDNERPVFPSAYVPYPFEPALNTGLTIRVAAEPTSITSAVRQQIREADPSLPVFEVRTLEAARQRSFWQDRLFGYMFSIFGLVALVLATVGVYGVLSYAVSQRTQEIGVRVALGAERRDVMRLVVGQGLRLAGVGVVVGIVAAFGVTWFIRSILFNVTPTDPLSFSTVSVFLIFVAIAASYIPARRAMAVDPIVALRND